jgi:serine protease Do
MNTLHRFAFATLLLATAGAAFAQRQDPAPGPVAGEPNLRMTNDVRVYQLVKQAVVNISSTRVVTARVGSGDEFFDRFFGGDIRQVPAQSLGTGFVIHSAGYLVTNEHVVDEGTDIECAFADGTKLPAKVIATDNEHDLAVLKVEPKKPLQAIALGVSEDLMIGEPVYAIGNPFGYAGTMTRGIVSAVDRTLEASPTKSYKGLIQTDASINPGNSGGPLLNAYGQVVGINTAIRADAHGIGFAISVSHMRDLLPAFLTPEVLNHAQVGFTVEERRTTRPPATVLASIFVKQVQGGSEAEKAGLRAGDQIVGVNAETVRSVVDALVDMAGAKPGDSLALQVLRGAGQGMKRLDLRIPVTKMPVPPVEDVLMTKLGVKGETVTPALARKFQLIARQGVFISEVKADSPAGRAGIQPGDVLFQIGRFYIADVDDLAQFLKIVRSPVDVSFAITRANARGRGVLSIK